MSRIFLLMPVIILCSALAVLAAGKRPDNVWNYYHFDGSAFSAGPSADGSAFVAVRENVRPVVVSSPATPIDRIELPDGAGAVAGICYTRSYGGKLGNGSGYRPNPRMPLLITSGVAPPVAVQTDYSGYFTAVLPAGSYAVSSGPFTVEVTVARGTTTLVPFGTGKRMVD